MQSALWKAHTKLALWRALGVFNSSFLMKLKIKEKWYLVNATITLNLQPWPPSLYRFNEKAQENLQVYKLTCKENLMKVQSCKMYKSTYNKPQWNLQAYKSCGLWASLLGPKAESCKVETIERRL
jgi:hypothetical protein